MMVMILFVVAALFRAPESIATCRYRRSRAFRGTIGTVQVGSDRRWTVDGGRWRVGGGRWAVDCGLWTVDGGRWAVDGGRWRVGGGRWAVDGGLWTVDGGRWTVDGGRRTVEGGRWTVGGGRWTVDCGRWTVDGGRWTADGGRWTVDGGRWTADCGLWTVDGGWWAVDSGRWAVDGGRWTVDGGRWTVGGVRWTVEPRVWRSWARLVQLAQNPARYIWVKSGAIFSRHEYLLTFIFIYYFRSEAQHKMPWRHLTVLGFLLASSGSTFSLFHSTGEVLHRVYIANIKTGNMSLPHRNYSLPHRFIFSLHWNYHFTVFAHNLKFLFICSPNLHLVVLPDMDGRTKILTTIS